MQERDCEKIEELAKYLDFQVPYNWGNVYENFGQGKGLLLPLEIEFSKIRVQTTSKSSKVQIFLEKIALYQSLLVLTWMRTMCEVAKDSTKVQESN